MKKKKPIKEEPKLEVKTKPKKFIKCAPINGYGCDCVDKCNFHIY